MCFLLFIGKCTFGLPNIDAGIDFQPLSLFQHNVGGRAGKNQHGYRPNSNLLRGTSTIAYGHIPHVRQSKNEFSLTLAESEFQIYE